jgi:hypothetical protein
MGYVWKRLLAGNLDDSCTCQAIAEFFFRRRWKMHEFQIPCRKPFGINK